jgi:hypothetical protein
VEGESKNVVLHKKTCRYGLKNEGLGVVMGWIAISLDTIGDAKEKTLNKVVNREHPSLYTHLQSSEYIDENSTVEHWL